MKARNLFLLIFFIHFPFSVAAIDVGDVTTTMSSDKSILAKEISNTTDMARYISLNIVRISSPMESGVEIPLENKGELLSTPASLILPGNAKENFRFIYKGPADDKERYYRLSWTDEPVTEKDTSINPKIGQATTSAIIGTILVVAPRKEHFDYEYKSGVVTNTGNSSFRIISFGPCRRSEKDSEKGCRERYYLMPKMKVKMQHTDLNNKKTRIGIWHNGTYINVE